MRIGLVSIFAIACGGGGGAASTRLDGGTAADSGADTAFSQLCVDTINQYRNTLHLADYTRWTSEETCVDTQAAKDGAANTAHANFTACGESAQNECPGYSSPANSAITSCLALMWAEGPGSDFSTHGHYINMSSTTYTKAACGVATLPSGSLWMAIDFQ